MKGKILQLTTQKHKGSTETIQLLYLAEYNTYVQESNASKLPV
jgi:hypothetical protein